MNAAMPISTSKWGLALAQKALALGYPAMNLEIREGRWHINLFSGFAYDSNKGVIAQWSGVTVQEFCKRMIEDTYAG